MTRKLYLFIIVVLSLWCVENLIGAEAVKLFEISGFKTDQVSRVSFHLDRIPEFKVENSGHRIRIILEQTNFDSTFRNMLQDDLIFQVETNENNKESTIDLFVRKIPKSVDVTVDRQNTRLLLSIFWNQQSLGGRPTISDQKFGELKTSSDLSTTQQVISSKYSGRWIDFFRDYEWPVNISLPINFVFPEFPSPLILDNKEALPQELLAADSKNMCDQIEKTLSENPSENQATQDRLLYDLLFAECLLRQKNIGRALDILNREDEESSNESNAAWKHYFQAYSRAVSGQYHLAGNYLSGSEERYLNVNGFAPWYRVLKAELELAKGCPEKVSDLLNSEIEINELFDWLYELRRADSFYQLGLLEDAYNTYQNVVYEPNLLKKYPYSLSNLADVLYQKKEYTRAFGHYFILSEVLGREYRQQKSLSDYRSAMAKLKAGDQEHAMILFEEIVQNAPKTEAGFRSRLKMIDLDVLGNTKPLLDYLLQTYDEIIKDGPIRNIREEAFFKKILVCHLYGDDCRAVKLLGRFIEHYWAGDLQAEAQALLVELFPKVVEKLVDQDAFLIALSLVAKHREILTQANITYDFLYNLAMSYSKAGFIDQAEETYLFMIDFEKNKEKKSIVFLPLIRIYHQKRNYEQVKKYASQYLKDYIDGNDRPEVLYYYADVLYKSGDVGSTVSLLLDKNRPGTKQLDTLAGDIFFELKKYDLVEYYLSRAATEDPNGNDHEITLKRAEAFFLSRKWKNAIPLYESLLDKPRLRGQAIYRLILIYYELGQNKEAIKLYYELTEIEVEKSWLKLATETVQSRKSIKMGN